MNKIDDDGLIEMARQSGVKGFEYSSFRGQEEAYSNCCDFVSTLAKTKSINNISGSYYYKHLVEQRSDISKHVYVYEGTFVLAAISCGFSWKQTGNKSVKFNISKKSLKEAIRLTERLMEEKSLKEVKRLAK